MKKILFLLFVIISFASFGQVPDTSRAKKVYGNMMWVKYDTTAATWDTLGIFPGATPEIWSSDGDLGYLSSNGDTVLGKTYKFDDGQLNITTLLGSSPCRMTLEKTSIVGGQINFETCDGNFGAYGSIGADSLVSDGAYIFSTPQATFTGDLYISERINGLYYQSDSTNLVNDASIILTNGISGWGEVYAFNAGAIDEWAEFIISSDGAVLLKSNSTDVVNTDTADKLCIFDNGSGVTIRNRLGGTRTIKYIIHH